MGLSPNGNFVDIIHRAGEKAYEQLQAVIIQKLSYLGELCVSEARQNHAYRDQTGNLTASIGYVIAYNGKVVGSNFLSTVKANKPKLTAASGSQKGQALARRIAKSHSQGWCLVVVAGMNYASAVESKGLNVLTTAEQLAQRVLPQLLTDLKLTVAQLQ